MPRKRATEEEHFTAPPEGWKDVTEDEPDAWPLLVAFDLDYTLWDLWIDTHISPPLKRNGKTINELVDRRGQDLRFYPDVPSILADLHRRRIHIAACSRTSAPELAREALGLLLVKGEGEKVIKSVDYFNTMEIYPGSKLRHFTSLHRRTGIPYSQMLFFDDEHRNFEVESLGVTMQLVPPQGTTWGLVRQGLERWRKKSGLRIVPSSALDQKQDRGGGNGG